MSGNLACVKCGLKSNNKKCRRFYINVTKCNFCFLEDKKKNKEMSEYGSTSDIETYRKNYYESNKKRIAEYQKANRIRHKKTILKAEKDKRKRTGSGRRASALRKAKKLMATPVWCDKQKLRDI